MNINLEAWKRTWSLPPRVTGSERLVHPAQCQGTAWVPGKGCAVVQGRPQGQSYLVPLLQGAQLHLFNGLLGPGPQAPLWQSTKQSWSDTDISCSLTSTHPGADCKQATLLKPRFYQNKPSKHDHSIWRQCETEFWDILMWLLTGWQTKMALTPALVIPNVFTKHRNCNGFLIWEDAR